MHSDATGLGKCKKLDPRTYGNCIKNGASKVGNYINDKTEPVLAKPGGVAILTVGVTVTAVAAPAIIYYGGRAASKPKVGPNTAIFMPQYVWSARQWESGPARMHFKYNKHVKEQKDTRARNVVDYTFKARLNQKFGKRSVEPNGHIKYQSRKYITITNKQNKLITYYKKTPNYHKKK